MVPQFFLGLFLLLGLATAYVAMDTTSRMPPAFILAGDSTTAVQSKGAGGWGNGFLDLLKEPAYGVNKGHPGATTVSFVNGGDWGECLNLVKNATNSHDVYVTIQFGHNDQKPAANISMPEFMTNLEALAADVEELGATPLIFTSLTRRNFNGSVLIDDLFDVVPATRKAAKAAGVALVDLNAASRKYVQAIASTNADNYNLSPGDRTHLNAHGSMVFGSMVADLIVDYGKHLGSWIQPNRTLSNLIAEGVYA